MCYVRSLRIPSWDLGRRNAQGQAKPAAEDLEGLSKSLSIPKEVLRESLYLLAAPASCDAQQLTDALGQGFYPQRGLGSMPPTDPLLYRLYEMILVFGQPIKVSLPPLLSK